MNIIFTDIEFGLIFCADKKYVFLKVCYAEYLDYPVGCRSDRLIWVMRRDNLFRAYILNGKVSDNY